MLAATAALSLGTGSEAGFGRAAAKPGTFVLVHGAWHGGWCYARVAELLRAKGHRVFTPTLTGLGERSHLSRNGVINCSTHIQDVLNVIRWEQLNDVVLCGHSYGGVVVCGVADAMPDRIASLVYLDSAVPSAGEWGFDQMDPKQILDFMRPLADHGGDLLPPYPAEIYNVNPADRAMVDALCTPQPFASFVERIKLTGAHEQVRKKTFVRATNWTSPPSLDRMYRRVKAQEGWTTVEVPTGHEIMLDAPERLAQILIAAL